MKKVTALEIANIAFEIRYCKEIERLIKHLVNFIETHNHGKKSKLEVSRYANFLTKLLIK